MDTSKGCAVNKLECLNESPSEKEGKLRGYSMERVSPLSLNESPSEKEGKSVT